MNCAICIKLFRLQVPSSPDACFTQYQNCRYPPFSDCERGYLSRGYCILQATLSRMNPRKKLKMSPQWSLVVSSCSCEEGRECFSPACSAVQKSYRDIMMRLEEEEEILAGTEERPEMIRSVYNSEIESVGTEEGGKNNNPDEISPSGSDLLTCSSIYLPTERQDDHLKTTQFGTQDLSGFDCCSSAAQGTFKSQQKNEIFNKSLLRSWMDPELARKCLLLAWWNVRRPHSAQEQLSEARTHGSYMDNEMNSCVRHPEHDVRTLTLFATNSSISP